MGDRKDVGFVGTDTHCHLQDGRFEGRLAEVLGRARAAGVRGFVCCGTGEGDWERVLALAAAWADVVPMLGLHPWWVEEAGEGWLARLRAMLVSSGAGVGEVGLDGRKGRPELGLQEACCEAQLRLAVELDRPVSIHCARAWKRLAALLRRTGVPRAGAVVHAFAGSPEVAAELVGLGLHLSFNGAVDRPGARRGPAALASLAPDRLLLETDAPFGPGPDCEPRDLMGVIEAAARLRGMAPEALARMAQSNALRLFGSLG